MARGPPRGEKANRTAGIGVQLPDNSEGETIRNKIETQLAGTLNADKPTQTM